MSTEHPTSDRERRDAVAHAPADQDPVEFWEQLYAGRTPIWSGKVNATFADIVGDLPVGRSLDLGSGEGGDVIWLAKRGWSATGVDLSETAVARARAAAEADGLDETRARFVSTDLASWDAGDTFDLVTASFFQSPVRLPRAAIIGTAARLLKPGGHLLVVSHAGAPSWSQTPSHMAHLMLAPDAELDTLDLPEERWERVLVEKRTREVVSPEGVAGTIEDGVILLRRR